MRVALLGPTGTYSHVAARQRYEDLGPVFCTTLGEVIRADADRALVPVENSLGGSVGETIDLLRSSRRTVSGACTLSIEHQAATHGDGETNKVRSHPQALDQCRSFIEGQGWDTVESPSTARAAQDIQGDEAAICSRLAAQENGLEVIRSGIQDNDSTTRFLELGGDADGGDRSVLLVEPETDRPGLLHQVLEAFAAADINLTQIQSRPTRTELGTYFFYIEAAAGPGSDGLDAALASAREVAGIDVLGGYTADQ